MSGKQAKQNRKVGTTKADLVQKRLEAQFAKRERKAILEGQKYLKGEESDPNVILAGLSNAEKLMLKGYATPSETMFKRLLVKGLAAIRKNETLDKPQIVPTGMAFVIKDMMDGKLTVIKGKKFKQDEEDNVVKLKQ